MYDAAYADIEKAGDRVRKWLCCVILPILLTGCGSDVIADRVYTQAISLRQSGTDISLSLQSFGTEDVRTVKAETLPLALQLEETAAGGRVFVGHTELLYLDGTAPPTLAEELFFTQSLSPACKVIYEPAGYLQATDSTAVVHTIRMAERDALLTETDLADALDDWAGAYRTALLPSPRGEELPRLTLLRDDGTAYTLSDAAARGMFWLRKPPRTADITVDGQSYAVSGVRCLSCLRDGVPLFTVRLKAKGADADECAALESAIQADCEAAAEALFQANADVIGIELLYAREREPLPEQVPLAEITVEVRG